MHSVAPCQLPLGEFSLEQQAELAEMLDRYLRGWEVGQPPSLSQWSREHPELEGALRQYIEQVTDLQAALEPVAGRGDAPLADSGLMHFGLLDAGLLDAGLMDAGAGDCACGQAPHTAGERGAAELAASDLDVAAADDSAAVLSCLAPRRGGPPSPRSPSSSPRGAAAPLGHAGPMQLGDYLIQGEIGRGGMGIVYRARQLSLGRDVAIKTLPFAAVLDPKQIKRFQNEAQAAAQLHHPNIVPVYAVGCERGVHYYSMQLIEGLSLEQVASDLRCGGKGHVVSHQTTLIQPVDAPPSPVDVGQRRAGTSPSAAPGDTKNNAQRCTWRSIRNRDHIDSVVRLGIQAAGALHYAHQCGVIHRDIKPSNLMIDARANLWITDFGLARCQQTTPMSVTGDLMGTLRYMSPEQASGRVHAVDHRTDIYSLGITLYELLTLQLAFDAPNRIELITLINQSSPISPRKLNPAIPADLETILCKAIRREPLERYESAADFAEDLQRFLRGDQPLAQRPTRLDRALKWVTSHQRLFLALAASLFLIVAGLTAATAVVSAHRHAAVEANARAELHLKQTHRVVHNFGTLVLDRLSDIREGQTIRKELLGELKNYYLDFIRYAQDQPELAAPLGQAHLQLAGVYAQSGHADAARAQLDQAIAVLGEAHTGDLRPAAARAAVTAQLAQAYAKRAAWQAEGDAPGAWQASLRRAISLQRQATAAAADSPQSVVDLAAMLAQRGELLLRHQRRGEATDSLTEAVTLIDRELGLRPADARLLELAVLCHNNLASIQQPREPARAAESLQRAIETAERLLRAEPQRSGHRVQLARVHSNAAALAVQRDDPAGAQQQYQQAIAHWTPLVAQQPHQGQYPRELAANHNSLGQLFLTQQDWQAAEAQFLAAIDTLQALESPTSESAAVLSDLASIQNNLGLCYEHAGQRDKATLWYTRSMNRQQEALSHEPENRRFLDRLALHRRNLQRLQTAASSTAASPSRFTD